MTSESLSMTPASQVFTNNGLEPEWNETYGSYYGEFEMDGALYKIWLEDARSIERK